MKSSAMSRSFGAFSGFLLGAASVLVFHSAAFAQQDEPAAKPATKPAVKTTAKPAAKPAAKEAEAPKAEVKAEVKAEPAVESQPKAEIPPKAEQPVQPDANAQQELPPEYGPPPGYRRGPQPPAPPPPPPGYGPQGYQQPYYGPGYQPYPPPAYPPPPPRYYRPRYYQPASPVRYYPEPLRFRPFFFGLGLGVGSVSIFPYDTVNYNDVSRAGMAYNLRFGFGVSPRWSIVLSADGAEAYFDGTNVSNTAWTIGPQFFITDKLYARAGIGAATYEDDGCYAIDTAGYCTAAGMSDSGMATTAALGFEFMQSYHAALALELVGTLSRYPNKDKISTIGVNFILLVF